MHAMQYEITLPADYDMGIIRERGISQVPAEDPAAAVHLATNRLRAEWDAHSTALAIDPRTWELVEFTLWAEGAKPEGTARYEVLHLSAPEAPQLSAGRHW
jgi:hypothetical protein